MNSSEQLPPTWVITKLDVISEIRTGKKDANHAKENGRYRFYTCAYDFMFCDTYSFEGQCIILPGNGANVGEVFYYKGLFESYQRTYVIEKIIIDPKYLFYHLLHNWKNINADKQYGSATNYIRIGNFTNYDVRIPPLNEQHRIVAKIEELFTNLDAAKAELVKAKSQVKRYRQSILKAAFEGKLTEEWRNENGFNEEWQEKIFNDFCKIQRGYDLPLKNLVEGKYPVVTSGGIGGYHNEYKAVGPCLVTGRSGSVGNIHYIEVESYWPHNTVLYVKDFCNNFPKYIYFYFSQFNFKSYSSSTAVPTLDRKQLYKVIVIVPKYEEQQQIVEVIESRFSIADKVEEEIEANLKRLESLHQSILKQAFEGKLVPQDPSDEPAEKLLERIKGERAKNKLTSKKD